MALDPSLILQGRPQNFNEALNSQADFATKAAALPGVQAESQLKQASVPYQAQLLQLDALQKKNSVTLQLLGMAQDEPSYQKAKAQAESLGIAPAGSLPETFPGSDWVTQQRLAAMGVDKQLEMMFKKASLGIDQGKLDVEQQNSNIKNREAAGKNPSLGGYNAPTGAPGTNAPIVPNIAPKQTVPPAMQPEAIDDNAPIPANTGNNLPEPPPMGAITNPDNPVQQLPGSNTLRLPQPNLPTNTSISTKGVLPDAVYNAMADVDKQRYEQGNANDTVANNAIAILDRISPEFDKVPTGSKLAPHYADATAAAKFLGMGGDKTAVAYGNLQKDSKDLVTELNKFQRVPGNRGSDLAMQTIEASKPSVDQFPEVNKNVTAGLYSKLYGSKIDNQVFRQYAEASPAKISDSQTGDLSDALKKLYPLETNKDGKITFNKDNYDKIQKLIPDAVKDPQKYIQQAQNMGSKDGAKIKTATMQDIMDTARIHKKTVNQVIKDAHAKGYEIVQ